MALFWDYPRQRAARTDRLAALSVATIMQYHHGYTMLFFSLTLISAHSVGQVMPEQRIAGKGTEDSIVDVCTICISLTIAPIVICFFELVFVASGDCLSYCHSSLTVSVQEHVVGCYTETGHPNGGVKACCILCYSPASWMNRNHAWTRLTSGASTPRILQSEARRQSTYKDRPTDFT